jgi:hypothetical protein
MNFIQAVVLTIVVYKATKWFAKVNPPKKRVYKVVEKWRDFLYPNYKIEE